MTCAVYAQSCSWPYLYEDANNPMPQTWREVVSRPPVMPTRWLSVTLQSAIGVATQHEPRAQRIASLLLHLCNGVLLWALARRIGLGLSGAVIAVGLFLLHPVQIEAVAAIAYRTELLIALSVLTAIWCAERGWLWLAFGVALLALLVKPAGVVALALVPLWASWRGLFSWTQTARLYWAMACWPIVLLGLEWIRGGIGFTLLWASPGDAVLTWGAWSVLVTQWVVPTGLSIDPDWARMLTGPVLLLVALGWGAAAWVAWCSRGLAFVLAWSVVLVLPRLLWQLGEGLHVHHLYLFTLVASLATGYFLTRRTCVESY